MIQINNRCLGLQTPLPVSRALGATSWVAWKWPAVRLWFLWRHIFYAGMREQPLLFPLNWFLKMILWKFNENWLFVIFLRQYVFQLDSFIKRVMCFPWLNLYFATTYAVFFIPIQDQISCFNRVIFVIWSTPNQMYEKNMFVLLLCCISMVPCHQYIYLKPMP